MEATMGKALLETLVQATGLPEGDVHSELQALMRKYGKSPETLTMDDLRQLMRDYVQDVLLETKESLSS
jgi:hypothetical protein